MDDPGARAPGENIFCMSADPERQFALRALAPQVP